MSTLKVIIKPAEGQYAAYAENAEGVYGYGKSIGKTLQSLLDSIRKLKAYTPGKVPEILKGDFNVEIVNLCF